MLDISMYKNKDVITRVENSGVKELRSQEKKEKPKSVRTSYRVEYGRRVELVESNGLEFKNKLEGVIVELSTIKNGLIVERINAESKITKEFNKILEDIIRKCREKGLNEYFKDNNGLEIETKIKGVTYDLSYKVKGEGQEKYQLNFINLTIKEQDITGEDAETKKERLRLKMLGVDIDVLGCISLNSVVSNYYDNKTNTIELPKEFRGVQENEEPKSEEYKSIKKEGLKSIKYSEIKDIGKELELSTYFNREYGDYTKIKNEPLKVELGIELKITNQMMKELETITELVNPSGLELNVEGLKVKGVKLDKRSKRKEKITTGLTTQGRVYKMTYTIVEYKSIEDLNEIVQDNYVVLNIRDKKTKKKYLILESSIIKK